MYTFPMEQTISRIRAAGGISASIGTLIVLITLVMYGIGNAVGNPFSYTPMNLKLAIFLCLGIVTAVLGTKIGRNPMAAKGKMVGVLLISIVLITSSILLAGIRESFLLPIFLLLTSLFGVVQTGKVR